MDSVRIYTWTVPHNYRSGLLQSFLCYMPESIFPDWACLHSCGTVRAQCSQFNLITESPGVSEARSSLPSILEIVVWKYLGKSWPFWSHVLVWFSRKQLSVAWCFLCSVSCLNLSLFLGKGKTTQAQGGINRTSCTEKVKEMQRRGVNSRNEMRAFYQPTAIHPA